ncbi:MAG: ABC transporter ATP-binding protein [Bacillales bacterium]|nr:ABC transporter ATP-binding protein [Bacillales bacterium]MDD7715104.1 ABC transporter ATP-binding protein [Mollicutes bacterium]MDY3903871.1 ABC transporter ATP-binding protein [Candidatus Enteromonas sp.]MDY4936126.1 ABC transporter ATP-binding protein [Candidatus Enteromonas sp.]
MGTVMEAKNLCKSFGQGEGKVDAIRNVNFKIEQGELTIILGPSGAGKSTLLNLIGGMDSATSGSLIVKGEDLSKFNQKQLGDYRRNYIGFVFQFYNLMPNLTAKENVELATELKKDALSVDKTLEAVGLGKRFNNFPSQLSGGEQQRVSVARAIAKNPDIILCDEPTGALDYETGKEILKLLSSCAKTQKKTVIIVTHNSALKDMADHLLRIKNGEIVLDEHNPNPVDIESIEW